MTNHAAMSEGSRLIWTISLFSHEEFDSWQGTVRTVTPSGTAAPPPNRADACWSTNTSKVRHSCEQLYMEAGVVTTVIIGFPCGKIDKLVDAFKSYKVIN